MTGTTTTGGGGHYEQDSTTVDRSTVCTVYTRTVQQLKDEMEQVNPVAMSGAATAWYSAAGQLGELANNLLTQAGTPLAKAWVAPSSTKAQEQLQLAQATARELANVCMQMAHAMDYSEKVATWYKEHQPQASLVDQAGAALSPAVSSLVDSALNDAAGQHLTNFMQRYREVVTDALPPQVQEKLLVPTSPTDSGVTGSHAGAVGSTAAPTIPGGGPSGGPQVSSGSGGPHATDPGTLGGGGAGPGGPGTGLSGGSGGLPGGSVTAGGSGPGGLGQLGAGSGSGVGAPGSGSSVGLPGSITGGGVDPYGATSQLAGGGPGGGIGSSLASGFGSGVPGSGIGGGIGSGIAGPGAGLPGSYGAGPGFGGAGLGGGIGGGLGGGVGGPRLGGIGGGLGGGGRFGGSLAGGPGGGPLGGAALAGEEEGAALGARGVAGGGAAAGAQGRAGVGPMMAGQGAGSEGGDRERSTWLSEDDDVWGGNGPAAPPLITG